MSNEVKVDKVSFLDGTSTSSAGVVKFGYTMYDTWVNYTNVPNVVAIDDTDFLSSEGQELFTGTFQPTSAGNLLRIQALVYLTPNVSEGIALGLFLDSEGTARAISRDLLSGTAAPYPLEYFMTAGTVASMTFKLRAGKQSVGNIAINGTNAARLGNGSLRSHLIITEYAQ